MPIQTSAGASFPHASLPRAGYKADWQKRESPPAGCRYHRGNRRASTLNGTGKAEVIIRLPIMVSIKAVSQSRRANCADARAPARQWAAQLTLAPGTPHRLQHRRVFRHDQRPDKNSPHINPANRAYSTPLIITGITGLSEEIFRKQT